MKLGKLKIAAALIVSLGVLTACSEKLYWIKYNDTILAVETTSNYCLAKGTMGDYLVYGTYPLFGKDLKAGQCALFIFPFKAFYRIKNLVDREPSLSDDPKALAQIKSQEELIKKYEINLEDL